NAANSTFNVSGDGNLSIAGFANAVNLQAGELTGSLIVTGSGANDILVGGSGTNHITGGNGVDTIDISKSAGVGGDWIDLRAVTLAVLRDVVIDFDAGAGGDKIVFSAINTSATTGAGQTATLQEVTTNTGSIVFNTAANDILELDFTIAGNGLDGNPT